MAENNLITSALTAYYDIFNHQIIEDIHAISTETVDFKRNSLEQHRELFDALKNHEAERAKTIAYDYLLDSMKYQLKINEK